MRWTLFLLLAGCSAPAEPMDMVCDPGKQEACGCPEGLVGVQECHVDGWGWGVCECTGEDGTGGATEQGTGGRDATGGGPPSSGGVEASGGLGGATVEPTGGTSSGGEDPGTGGAPVSGGETGSGGIHTGGSSAGGSGTGGAGVESTGGGDGTGGDDNCECKSGPCCDGCNFRPSTHQCAFDRVASQECGAEEYPGCNTPSRPAYSRILISYEHAWCSGESSECDGRTEHTKDTSGPCSDGLEVCRVGDYGHRCEPCSSVD